MINVSGDFHILCTLHTGLHFERNHSRSCASSKPLCSFVCLNDKSKKVGFETFTPTSLGVWSRLPCQSVVYLREDSDSELRTYIAPDCPSSSGAFSPCVSKSWLLPWALETEPCAGWRVWAWAGFKTSPPTPSSCWKGVDSDLSWGLIFRGRMTWKDHGNLPCGGEFRRRSLDCPW